VTFLRDRAAWEAERAALVPTRAPARAAPRPAAQRGAVAGGALGGGGGLTAWGAAALRAQTAERDGLRTKSEALAAERAALAECGAEAAAARDKLQERAESLDSELRRSTVQLSKAHPWPCSLSSSASSRCSLMASSSSSSSSSSSPSSSSSSFVFFLSPHPCPPRAR